jgi:hypothetical protein
MKKALRDAWLKALRSGDYKQTIGILHRIHERQSSGELYTPGHCCLGVLCDVMIKEGDPRMQWQHPEGANCEDIVWKKDGIFNATLPEELRQEIGFSQYLTAPDGKQASVENILVHLNDTQRETFIGIANWIEENIPVEE